MQGIHGIDLARLEAFVEVAGARSFSRAAERLNLTQPTVSARIAQMEAQLGVGLFERLGRRVRLTDAGRALLPHAQRTLQAARDAAEAVHALRAGGGGSLVIGTAPTVGTYVLPGLLQRYAAAQPNVEISIRTGRSQEVSQMVLDDEVQIGFERELGHAEIESVPLYEDDIVLLASRNHRLAAEGLATPSEIANEAVIFFDTGSSYHAISQAVFHSSGVAPRHSIDVDSLEMAKRLVLRGLGLAFLPKVAVEEELNRGELAPVDIESAMPIRRSIAVIRRRRRSMSDAALSFLSLVGHVFGVEVMPDVGQPGRGISRRLPATP